MKQDCPLWGRIVFVVACNHFKFARDCGGGLARVDGGLPPPSPLLRCTKKSRLSLSPRAEIRTWWFAMLSALPPLSCRALGIWPSTRFPSLSLPLPHCPSRVPVSVCALLFVGFFTPPSPLTAACDCSSTHAFLPVTAYKLPAPPPNLSDALRNPPYLAAERYVSLRALRLKPVPTPWAAAFPLKAVPPSMPWQAFPFALAFALAFSAPAYPLTATCNSRPEPHCYLPVGIRHVPMVLPREPAPTLLVSWARGGGA